MSTSIDVEGRIRKAGSAEVRRALWEAAAVVLKHCRGRMALKAWGLKLAKGKCHVKIAAAVARKLVVIMHAIWRDGSEYVAGADAADKPAGKGRMRSRAAVAAAAA